jgi:protein-S-isoprenylcysteine O-methyltransferase Ste14
MAAPTDPARAQSMVSRDHANVRLHPPVLLAIFLLTALLIHRITPLAAGGALARWFGLGLVLAGILPALLAVRQFVRAGTTLNPHGSARVLVTDGPYRLSRNPIYLGYVGTQIGLPLALGSLWGLVLAPALVLALQQLVIRPEESYLHNRFPDEYSAYRKRVSRWF